MNYHQTEVGLAAGQADGETAQPLRIEIERDERLSRSVLWSLQRQFFEAGGIDAWRQGIVPHYVTSNPAIARAYAKVVHGYLRDVTTCSGAGVFHIVELGSGSGRFAFHFLRKFTELMAHSPLRGLKIRYVMTDFAESTIGFWRENQWLAPFVAAGLLDFARFDVETGDRLDLVESGESLSPDQPGNPLTVIANYVFDGVRTDCFAVRDGKLLEGTVTVHAPLLADAALLTLDKVETSFAEQPIEGAAYGDAVLDGILEDYRRRLSNTQFLLPVAAFRCIRSLSAMSSGRMMLLTADKGHTRERLLNHDIGPQLVMHGSFSLMVNYHAIGQFVGKLGGRVLQPRHHPVSLQIGAYLLGPDVADHAETALAFFEAIDSAGPDDLFSTLRSLPKAGAGLDLDDILAAIRVSGFDGQIFYAFFERIHTVAADAAAVDREELRWTMAEVWRNYYHMGEKLDLPFYMGAVSLALKYHADALAYFGHSLALFGADPSTFANIALCHHHLGQFELAEANVARSLALNPEQSTARALQLTLEEEAKRRPARLAIYAPPPVAAKPAKKARGKTK